MKADSTNLYVRFGSATSVFYTVALTGASGYEQTALSNSYWKIEFVAGNPTGWTSADQTVTAGSKLALSHTLGNYPRGIHAALVCQTAEHNFSVGDVIWSIAASGGSSASGCIARVPTDSKTTIDVGYLDTSSGVFSALDFSTGQVVKLTNANWKLRLFLEDNTSDYASTGIVSGGNFRSLWPSGTSYSTESFSCATADNGYGVNDIICPLWFSPGADNTGASVRQNNTGQFATQSTYAQTMGALSWTTLLSCYLTDASWYFNMYSE